METTRHKKEEKIILFNPSYNISVRTNVGKLFITIIYLKDIHHIGSVLTISSIVLKTISTNLYIIAMGFNLSNKFFIYESISIRSLPKLENLKQNLCVCMFSVSRIVQLHLCIFIFMISCFYCGFVHFIVLQAVAF